MFWSNSFCSLSLLIISRSLCSSFRMPCHACHGTDEITRLYGESWSNRRTLETSASATTFLKTVCPDAAFSSILYYYETSHNYLLLVGNLLEALYVCNCISSTSTAWIDFLIWIMSSCPKKCMHLLYASCFGARWFTKEGWKIRKQNVQGMVCIVKTLLFIFPYIEQ